MFFITVAILAAVFVCKRLAPLPGSGRLSGA